MPTQTQTTRAPSRRPIRKPAKAAKKTAAKKTEVAKPSTLEALGVASLGELKITRTRTLDAAMGAALAKLQKSAEEVISRYCAVGDLIATAKALVDDKTGDAGAFKRLWAESADGKPWGIGYSTATRYMRAADVGAAELLKRLHESGDGSLNIKRLMNEHDKTPERAPKPASLPPVAPASVEPEEPATGAETVAEGIGPQLVSVQAAISRATDEELTLIAQALRQEAELRNLRGLCDRVEKTIN